MRFRDRRGRSWTLALDIGAALRLRDQLGVDVLDTAEPWGERLDADPALLVDCLFEIVQPDAKARGVGPADFGRSLKGRYIVGAMLALTQAAGLFFPETDPDRDGEQTPADGESLSWDDVLNYAGFVGVDPKPLTLRELIHMARGRYEYESRLLWEPLSKLMAITLNGNPYRKDQRTVKEESLNPWHAPKRVDFSQPRTEPIL